MAGNEEERLIRAGSSETYFILSQMDGNNITLTVTDGINAWIGIIQESSSKMASSKITVSFDDYMNDIRKAFSGDGNFHFEFEKNESKLKLKLKKQLSADNLKIQFGGAILKKNPSPLAVICDMFMSTITNSTHKDQKILDLMKERERLEKENDKSKELLEKLTDEKDKTEKDLYSKFILVLNEKKAKIRDLKEQLNGDQDNNIRPSTSEFIDSPKMELSPTAEEVRRPAPKKKKLL